MARLSELLRGMAPVSPGQDREIRGLCADSREAGPGVLFCALAGARGHGLAHAREAAARGAAAVAYEAGAEPPPDLDLPCLPVAGLGARLGEIARRFHGPQGLTLVGVTGTNGKTTCAHLLAQALDGVEGRCGVIGTLGAGLAGRLAPTGFTTPGVLALHRLLAELAAAGARRAVLEVSSHGLDQGRVEGLVFHTAVLTNLSRDHLDYHGDMAAYAAAKRRLFHWPGLQAAVLNAEDPFGRSLLAELPGGLRVLSYGLGQGEVRLRALGAEPGGLRLDLVTPAGAARLDSPLLGRFNAANLLASVAALLALGLELGQAVERLASARPVPGRMEVFSAGPGRPRAVVDYAHTPDALEKVLAALRAHTPGRLYCVFGCGGDRDAGKRPLMGRVAEGLADVVVLTDDNPRHESPAAIVADIRAGMRGPARVIHDRVEAIRWALAAAGPGDTVLVAGKGHETTQQVGDRRLPLSDRETVSRWLEEAA